jgi:hypothetical protein
MVAISCSTIGDESQDLSIRKHGIGYEKERRFE